MGNASSMLTQYDIEDVQDHCNHLCKAVLFIFFFLLILFYIPSMVFTLSLKFFALLNLSYSARDSVTV